MPHSEVSQSYFEVASIEVAERLGRGERVQADYVDDADIMAACSVLAGRVGMLALR